MRTDGRAILWLSLSLLVAGQTACKDPDLKRVADGLKVTAEAVGVVQETVIAANKAGTLSDNDTRRILEVCVKVNQAGQEASLVTRNLYKLEVQDRNSILKILDPVIEAVRDGAENGLIGVSEPTKGRLKTLLGTVQSTLFTVQLVLQSGT